jgi:hypothetical protein
MYMFSETYVMSGEFSHCGERISETSHIQKHTNLHFIHSIFQLILMGMKCNKFYSAHFKQKKDVLLFHLFQPMIS